MHSKLKNCFIRTQKILITILLYFSIGSLWAQVPANINSGNPKFPFPQFLDYTNPTTTLKTLASQNSPGVTHAEMEQRIRDAYQILLNNIILTGDVVAGVNYSRIDNSTCTCAEGYGYYLLAMAYMADKTNFDRLWMFVHDNSIVKARRYIDGNVNNPTALYSKGMSGAGNFGTSTNVLGGGAISSGDATDGNVDIAFALLMANMQWGPNSGITPPATGVQMSYQTEAINYMKGMTDTIWTTTTNTPNRYTTGNVGMDGYLKSGSTFTEQTNWANAGYAGKVPEYGGSGSLYFDYSAPAYFREYRKWLATQGPGLNWNIDQFKRAEASADWQMGQLISAAATRIPFAGGVTMAGTTASFTSSNIAEDVRAPWRTILNYVWHGNPDSTWNPTTHQVVPGVNTYERDAGIRFGTFLKNPQGTPWNNPCRSYGSSLVTYNGVPSLCWGYSLNGAASAGFHINWIFGSGSPSAVVSQDFDLMNELFRECVIEWDQQNTGQQYLNSKPVYFHEWFRLLGMLVLTGNAHAPLKMVPSANMKVYKAVDKTFAYPGDNITYTISYRNYGTVNATSVAITDVIPSGLQFVSASNGGSLVGNTVTWNIGTVNGFVTGGLAATQGSVTLVVKVAPTATGRICNVANITCSNGTGWTSNEYPNNQTDVMERNCVDIISRPLYINKNANVRLANPGQIVDYTLDFGNQSTPYLNGGRPGVTVAYANNGTAPATQLGMKFRINHGADEAYINYQNYRISYFISDASTNWLFNNTIYEGGLASGVTTTQQNLNAGSDVNGAWNQRVIVQFANQRCTTSPHLYNYYGLTMRVHEGGTDPLRAVWNVNLPSFATVNWADDWSADNTLSSGDGTGYFPITNDWTDPYNLNIPVTKLHKHACETATRQASKILVEEWDGYTWRRVFGKGPVSGREIQNVVLTDVIPVGLTFGGFNNATALGVTATYNAGTRTITWTIPLMRINDIGQLKYWVTVNSAASFGGCPLNTDLINVASISGTNESAAIARDTVTVTCVPQPPPPPPPSSLIKTVTSGAGPYVVGNTISYSLSYTNTTGSIADPNLNTNTDWTRQSGTTNFNFGSGIMSTVNNQNTVMTYGFAHGTNGTLTGTINAAGSATVGVAMRHTGGAVGNGVYVTFNQNGGAGTVVITFWNGTTQVSTGTYPLASGPISYQLVLNGGTVSLWLNNFTGAPLLTQTGMTVQAGYAGIINGDPAGANTFGIHQITDFVANMDSGFNIQLYDPVPSNVTYVSSSNSGTFTTGTVTWPMTNTTSATPLLAGTTITRTWTGTVNNCSTGFISNTGFIKIFGVTPDPGGQANVGCNSTVSVNWLFFNVAAQENGNLLQWSTASEINNSHFVVERSGDGKNFRELSQVKGYGNTLSPQAYAFLDSLPLPNLNYYRLKQVDYDKGITYSEIKMIRSGSPAALELYPNPALGSMTVSSLDTPYDIECYDAMGKIIYQKKNVEESNLIVDLSSFSKGVYLIRVHTADKVFVRSFVTE